MSDDREREDIREAEDYMENEKLINEFQDILMKLFTKTLTEPTQEEIQFAEHLATYLHQKLMAAIQLGMGRAMLPISDISVWYIMHGENKAELTYRVNAIGGEPYVKLNLQRISELLENAVGEWADENCPGIMETRQDRPAWVVDNDDNE